MIPDIVTIGGISLDWVVTATGEFSLKKCGGNALYSAVAARLWNDRVGVIGVVGQDYPLEFLTEMATAGIDISGIRTIPEPHEQVYAVEFNAEGERHNIRPREFFPPRGVTSPEALEDHIVFRQGWDHEIVAHFDPSLHDAPPAYAQARAYHVCRMHRPAQLEIVQELGRRSTFFTLDSGCLGCDEAERRRLLAPTPALLPSQVEVLLLLGQENLDPRLAAEQLATYGPQIVAIKMGGEGSLVYDARTGLKKHVPVYPTVVKDPTGAGDSYCGGFLAGYLETGDVFEAALRGTVSASFAIQDFDARYPLRFTRRAAESRLDALRNLAS